MGGNPKKTSKVSQSYEHNNKDIKNILPKLYDTINDIV